MGGIPSGPEGIRSPSQIRSEWTLKFLNHHADTAVVMNDEIATATAIQAVESTAREGEILTVTEVALFLRVPKSTVYKLARVGELPASKIGKHWRFLRRDIHEWMHGRSRQGERSASRSLFGPSAE
ncbi:MAG: helix-turn-helix domain-containing protein [Nitrospira sp.]